ncbi:hypothetical protein KIPB_006126 [Kipferlia bialata]|uniref:Uncharacterized protein n=1 Tax=Kipferlia bialata TaxID=797122 RepID=A0A9K3GJI3_9EUKA|nr:hypothetical protein KIPB_006126 [Kipferlia bialata]|eukprot:g6126.t1
MTHSLLSPLRQGSPGSLSPSVHLSPSVSPSPYEADGALKPEYGRVVSRERERVRVQSAKAGARVANDPYYSKWWATGVSYSTASPASTPGTPFMETLNMASQGILEAEQQSVNASRESRQAAASPCMSQGMTRAPSQGSLRLARRLGVSDRVMQEGHGEGEGGLIGRECSLTSLIGEESAPGQPVEMERSLVYTVSTADLNGEMLRDFSKNTNALVRSMSFTGADMPKRTENRSSVSAGGKRASGLQTLSHSLSQHMMRVLSDVECSESDSMDYCSSPGSLTDSEGEREDGERETHSSRPASAQHLWGAKDRRNSSPPPPAADTHALHPPPNTYREEKERERDKGDMAPREMSMEVVPAKADAERFLRLAEPGGRPRTGNPGSGPSVYRLRTKSASVFVSERDTHTLSDSDIDEDRPGSSISVAKALAREVRHRSMVRQASQAGQKG